MLLSPPRNIRRFRDACDDLKPPHPLTPETTFIASFCRPCNLYRNHQVAVETATSVDPIYPYIAGPTVQGLSWRITFPAASGDVSSLIVSTGNGAASIPGSVLASAGTLTGTDPFVTAMEVQKGGVLTSLVTPEEGLESGTAYAVRVKAYNGIAWSEVNTTRGLEIKSSQHHPKKHRQRV